MNATSATLPEKILCTVVSLALAIAFVPAFSLPAYADETAADGQSRPDIDIDALLAAGDYVEGQAIAVVRADLDVSASGFEASLQAEALLDGGETLMGTSAETVEEALGIALPSAKAAAGEDASLSAVSTPADEAVQIVLVSDPNLTTREIIEQLLADGRVISAEPNHITTLEDTQDADLDDAVAAESAALSTTASADGSSSDATLAGASAPTTVVTENGGLTEKDGYYDMTSWQWAYDTDSSAFKRTNDDGSVQADDTVGIAGWNTEAGKGNAEGTVVAILDTGVDYENPDLAGVMVSGENSDIAIACGGGKYGYNASGDGAAADDYMDHLGHGTHCAGIVAAEWNGTGTSGVADGAQILAVRVMCVVDGVGASRDDSTLRAYDYLCNCAKKGMNLVATNNSYCADLYNGYAQTVAVTNLGAYGVVSVFGTGNSDFDNDVHPSTPSCLAENPYTIAVSASQHTQQKATYSSYGQVTGNVFSPGSEIVSTYSSTSEVNAYGPADTDPLYRNYFTSAEGLASKIWVSKCKTDPTTGTEIIPTSFEDLGDFADNVSFSADASVDAVEGSGSLHIAGVAGIDKSSANYWVAIPVAADTVSDIKTFTAIGYGQTDGGSDYARCRFQYVETDDAGTAKLVADPGTTGGTGAASCWSPTLGLSTSLIDEGCSLYTIPMEQEDVVLLLLHATTFNMGEEGLFLDCLTVHGSASTTNGAQKWMLEKGTSMATPAVTGCAAVVGAKIEGSDAQTAIARANYLKAHVIPVEELADKCTQGGIINLSVADTDLVPVVNKAVQNDDGTVTLTGAYFGATAGGVQIGGATASIKSWSDTEIVVAAAASVDSGEQVIAVTGANDRTGRFKMPYRSQAANRVQVFEDTLQSPDTATSVVDSDLHCILSGRYANDSSSISMSISLAAAQGKVYATALDSYKTQSYRALLCYDPATDSWEDPLMFSDFFFGEDLVPCTIAAYDDEIIVFGTGAASGALYLATYDPSNGAFTKYDTSALKEDANANTSLSVIAASDDGLYLIGGMGAESFAPADIGKLTLSTAGDTPMVAYEGVGKINLPNGTSAAVLPRVTEHNGAFYIGSYSSFDLAAGFGYRSSLLKLEKDAEGVWQTTDLTGIMPELLTTDDLKTGAGCIPTYALAEVPGGIVISGASVDDGTGNRSANDTYILKDGADEFTAYERSASLGVLFNASSVYADGYLYTLAGTNYSEGGDAGAMLFRRTAMGEQAEAATRLDGADRYETMLKGVEAQVGTTHGKAAVLASGANFPDALAASALAGVCGGSVVLTEPDALGDCAKQALEALAPDVVYVVGGADAVSDAVLVQASSIAPVTRIAGEDRVETAQAVNAKAAALAQEAGAGVSDTCIVASGSSFADALAISPYAYAKASGIYLTGADGALNESTLSAMRGAGYSRAIVVGGTEVVSDAVEEQLEGAGIATACERLAGTDRYETASLVVDFELANGMACKGMAVATGRLFPDALSASSLCGCTDSVLCLTDGRVDELCDSVAQTIERNRASIGTLYLAGGTDAVSVGIETQVGAILAGK